MQQTNQPALNFAGLLAEGLAYVDSWTPTFINEGGCGVFAQLLSKELTDHGIEHKIYALFYKGNDPSYESNLKKFLETGKVVDKDGTGANHICILVDGSLYVDSTGIINKEVAMATDKIEMTFDQLNGLVEKGGWNPTFDKGCIPLIREHIQEIFKHLDDFHTGMFKFPAEDEVVLTPYTLKYKRYFGGFSPISTILSSLINNK